MTTIVSCLLLAAVAHLVVPPSPARADETVTVATYNIEHFQSHFSAYELGRKPPRRVQDDPAVKEMLYQLRKANDEDNWEAAQVILDPQVNPDVLVIEEGCTQDNLEFFNRRWLNKAYATAITFPTNTGERHQHLNMLLKPGFTVLERRDQYYLEPDPAVAAGGPATGPTSRPADGRPAPDCSPAGRRSRWCRRRAGTSFGSASPTRRAS